MPKSNQTATTNAALRKQVAELEAEVSRLQTTKSTQQASKKPRTKFSWQALVIWLGVALATALLVVGNIFFWAGNTVVNTDRYVAAVGPLIQKPEIQSAVATYTTAQIFKNVDVEGYVESVLPPRADALAPQLTSQLNSYTQTTIKVLLANPKVQSAWYTSLERRHTALISYAQNYEGNGTIEVSDIYSQLSKRLADTKLSFLANKQLPANAGSIKVTTVGWLPVLHKIAKNIGIYQTVTTLLFLAITAGVIALARKKRKMAIRLGSIFAISTLATLISTRIAGSLVASHADPMYQSAVRVAYDTVMHAFVVQTTGILLLSLLLVVIAWISGPYNSANLIKSRTSALLSGRLHQSVFGSRENGLTRWVGKNKRYLQWGAVALLALVMVIVQLSPSLILIYALLILVCILVIEFLAAPASKA